MSNTTQILTQSFGIPLITSVLNPGVTTKVNPVVLVKKDEEEKEFKEKAVAQKIKEQEVAKLNGIKEKMSSMRKSGGAVTLRNLLGGS